MLSDFRTLHYCPQPPTRQNAFSMTIHNHSAAPPNSDADGFFRRVLFPTNHKHIALQYLWLSLASVLVGMLLSTIMRMLVSWPDAAIPFLRAMENAPERYAAIRLLHGSLMVFFVLTAAPQLGFGNYFVPLQIGAPDMAFPRLNRLSFWMTFGSLLLMSSSFLPPLAIGLNTWLASAFLFSLAGLLSAINFTTTILQCRTEGMTLPRMPVTVWAWLINAILSMLIFSVLLAGSTALLSDRILGSHFFSAAGFLAANPQNLIRQAALPVLWQRLFWYFAQAQVYVAMLPCFGIVTHVIATFARRPVWRERLVVLALCGVGLVGFCVWGYHMFATGMNPYAPLVFSVLASSLGIPASILVVGWMAMIWRSRETKLPTSALFSIGFVSLFVSGGLSGIFLAKRGTSTVSEEFVIGHFHLVMGVAATFAILSALFFWFPRMFQARLDERIGKLHFWITFAGVYAIFLPMHWLGMLAQAPGGMNGPVFTVATVQFLRTFITVATVVTVSAQLLFVFNFFRAVLRLHAPRVGNPWSSATLEWAFAAGNVPPTGNPHVYRGAYEVSAEDGAFVPQSLAPTPSDD